MHWKWLLVLFLYPALAFGSENCVTQFGGTCKDRCTSNETAAEGAFIDCGEKQECCIEKAAKKEGAVKPAGDDSGKPQQKP